MNISKIFDILDIQQEQFPLDKAFSNLSREGSLDTYSIREFRNLVNQFSLGLIKKGLKKGDKIAMITYHNCPEWNIADFGMLQIGVINVPVYSNNSPEDYVYIFNETEIKYCIVGSGDLLDKVMAAQPAIPSLLAVYTFEELPARPIYKKCPIYYWKDLLNENENFSLVNSIKQQINEDDLATIIYTSGTTGKPKGVMLSHRNIVSNIIAISDIMLIKPGGVALSFLPLCHGLERTMVYCYIYKSLEVHYSSIPEIGQRIIEVKPNIMTAVPRILEKVHEKIIFNVQKSSWLKKVLFFWAETFSKNYDFHQKHSFWYQLQFWFLDKIIFKRFRNSLGGKLEVVAVGASACPQKILQFFCTAGIPVREGYGLTETSAVLSANLIPKEGAMLGTVGQILKGFQVSIDVDPKYENGTGEILVKGTSIFKGYYKNEEKTLEAFNKEGWFLTGDIGKLIKNESGATFLKITDRKKELMKSSNGKYIAPTFVEQKLKESFYISNAMVVGENRKYVTALVVPEIEILKNWLDSQGKEATPNVDILKNPEVTKLFDSIMNTTNEQLSHHEMIKKYTLLNEIWSTETGELTPTLKLKRRIIENKFAKYIDSMYL